LIITDTNDIAENKLIILYIAEEMALPMSKKIFSNIVIKGNLMNYFVMLHLLDSLIENKYLYRKDDKLIITPKGSETLTFLNHKIPKGIRKYIKSLASAMKNSVKKDLEIKADFSFGNVDDFIVDLEILDNDSPLLSVSFRFLLELVQKRKLIKYVITLESILMKYIMKF